MFNKFQVKIILKPEDKFNCKLTIQVHDRLGLRIPINIGVANLVMLANLPKQQMMEIVDDLVPEMDKKAFMERLQAVKSDGYIDERTEGITCVASPIPNRFKQAEGAVSIRLVSFNLTENMLNETVQKVVRTGNNISPKMGYPS